MYMHRLPIAGVLVVINSSKTSPAYAFHLPNHMDLPPPPPQQPLILSKQLIQGVIFDLDGTLLDTETLSDHAMFAALNISPKDVTNNINNDAGDGRLPWELKRQILGLRSSDWGTIVLNYAKTVWGLPEEALPSSAEALATQWEERLNEYCGHVEACRGACELVRKLAALQIPMAIATSSRQVAVEQKRKNHHGIFQYIPTIVCGDHPNVKRGKPAPDIYLEAARQMNVSPEHCLVFEDAMNGIQSAKSAGCAYVVAIPDARYDSIELEQFRNIADMVIPDLFHFDGTTIGVDIHNSSENER